LGYPHDAFLGAWPVRFADAMARPCLYPRLEMDLDFVGYRLYGFSLLAPLVCYRKNDSGAAARMAIHGISDNLGWALARNT
jgi:hypothetical protein